jgi:hypothetical protein
MPGPTRRIVIRMATVNSHVDWSPISRTHVPEWIAGTAAGLKLTKQTITTKLSKASSGKATFKIVLETNGRPTTEPKSVSVTAR